MIRLITLMILCLSCTSLFAYEEICLVGDKESKYKFYPDEQQQVGIPPMYQQTFDSLGSACVSMLNKFLASDFWAVGHISRSGQLQQNEYYCEFTLKPKNPINPDKIYEANLTLTSNDKDCSCPDQQTRNFYGQCVDRCPIGSTYDGEKCVLTSCPVGQHVEGTLCVEDEKPPELCPDGYYRGDDNFCHKFCEPGQLESNGQCLDQPQCPLGETEVNGVCTKPLEPTVCDSESQWLFLCQWYEDFKNFVSDIHTYFSELLNKQDQIHSENKEFQTQVLQKLDNQNPTGNGSGTSILVPDHSATDRQTIIQNQEKQLTQDKDFQDKTLEFYDWFKKEKEDEENPQTPNNNSVVEEQNVQVDEQQRVNWSASCPMNEAPKELTLNGLPPVSLGFDNYELCTMAQKMRPLILLAGAFISMLIIAGGLRK